MEKALEILKEIMGNKILYFQLAKQDFSLMKINKAIAELEAMKPKTCEGCKWLAIGKYCTLPTGCCIRKSDDYFEPKDNA